MDYTIPQPRLSWSKIKEIFCGEWVELVDFEWPWERPAPAWGRVRLHASDRADLMRAIERRGEVEDAIVLYIGNTAAPIAHLQESAAL